MFQSCELEERGVAGDSEDDTERKEGCVCLLCLTSAAGEVKEAIVRIYITNHNNG